MPELGLNISTRADRAVIEVSGEVDMASAAELFDAIVSTYKAHGVDVTVDLGEVAFMDSQGVATLLLAHRQLAASRGRLRIDNASRGVAMILNMTGVSDYLRGDDERTPTL